MKDFLAPEQRHALRRRHRLEHDGRIKDRIKAVLLKDKGWSHAEIAEALMINEETSRCHLNDYLKKNKLKPENGGSEGKLTPTQKDELLLHLEATTYAKAKDIAAYIKATYGISYSSQGITDWLHAHGFSYKKPVGRPLKADPVAQAAFIKAYEEFTRHTPDEEPIIFIDAVHPTMATKIAYGWIKKGAEKPIFTTASRSRVNVVGALNLETMDVDVRAYSTVNSSSISQYFGVLRGLYSKAPLIHVICDGAAYHKSRQTKEAAMKYGIKIHYLPPYSPNLNPIERVWRVMNETVRNNQVFTTKTVFEDAILGFFTTTWPEVKHALVDRINDNFQTFPPKSST